VPNEDKFSDIKKGCGYDCTDLEKLDCPSNLQFRTFDSLIKLVDDLAKADTQIESMIRRLEKATWEFCDIDGKKPDFQILAQGSTTEWKTYLTKFKWDTHKFGTADIAGILKKILDVTTKLDESGREKFSKWTEVKGQAQTFSKNKEGLSLGTRDLIDVLTPGKVNSEDFIETEHLTTVCVVVSKGEEMNFEKAYQEFAEDVVPESAKRITGITDKEGNALYRVVMFKTSAADFRNKARANRFTAREFTYNPNAYQTYDTKRKDIEVQLLEAEKMAKNITRAVFSDTFTAWIHIKVLRCFVESVLRYGLSDGSTPKFTSAIMVPKAAAGNIGSIRKCLASLCPGKDNTENVDGEEEFHPYVYLPFTPLAIDPLAA